MNIFFDLDGTLIDAKPRLFLLFQHLVPSSSLSFEEYWEMKRNKMTHKQILLSRFNYTDNDIETFQANWMTKIESPEWLTLDKPFDDVSDYLKELKKSNTLFVITHRQFKEVALHQLDQFGWRDIFEEVFVTSQKTEKYTLIKEGVKVTKNDWLVGDTGNDIDTGKKLGIHTAAVLSGFLNREKLSEYSPDVIADDVLKVKFI